MLYTWVDHPTRTSVLNKEMAALLRIFSPFRVYRAIQEIEYITRGFFPPPHLGLQGLQYLSAVCPFISACLLQLPGHR